MNTKLLVAFGVLVAIASVIYATYTKKVSSSVVDAQTSQAFPIATGQIYSLRIGGNSYAHPDGVFVFLYPTDYKLSTPTTSASVNISKIGPSQTGQTEMYDGVSMTFETINLKGKVLKTWIGEHIKSTSEDQTIQIVEQPEDIVVNGYPGFTYTATVLSTAQYFILQKDGDSEFAVSVAISVNDPNNQGFDEEVDAIISTLQILK